MLLTKYNNTKLFLNIDNNSKCSMSKNNDITSIYGLQSFDFIKKRPYSSISNSNKIDKRSIEENYTREQILNIVTVRDCSTNSYYTAPSHKAILEYINQLPENERTFHEVIFGFQPQKLKVDIDIKEEDLINFDDAEEKDNIAKDNNINYDIDIEDKELEALFALVNLDNTNNKNTKRSSQEKAKHILDTIIEKINDLMYVLYLKENSHIIITDSSGIDKTTNKYKYSFHIIMDGCYVKNNKEAQLFTQELMKTLSLKYQKFIDSHVNKDIQCFRIIGCQKNGTGRIKRMHEYNKRKNSINAMITYINNCEELFSLVDETNNNKGYRQMDSNLTDDDIKNIVKESKDVTYGFKLRANKGNILIFERKYPTHCAICNEVHHNDNTLMLNTSEKKLNDNCSVINIYMTCRHYKGKSLYVGKVYRGEIGENEKNIEKQDKIQEVLNWKERKIQKIIDEVDTNGINCTTLFDTLPDNQKTVYDEAELRCFECKDTLVVKAAMKMGKSKKLRELLIKEYDNKLVDPKILILAFRQTWSSSVKEGFPDFTLYSDVKGKLDQNKLIVQIESLQRLQVYGQEPFDCLVLDECESIFEQFDSGNVKEFNAAFATFQYLIKYSKQVILMDAHISDRTFRLIQRFRGLKSLHYHYNSYKNSRLDEYFVTSKQPVWLKEMIHSIEIGKKICIPISSLAEAQTIYEHLHELFPAKKIQIYSSQTSFDEKKEHFSNVNEYWKEFDILIYTPTVSAGVSFEQLHYDRVFGYFTDKSCNVETCIQMIGRIRNVSDHKLYICFNTMENNLPTNATDIETALVTNRENLFKNATHNLLSFEYGPYGNIEYSKNDYYYVWLENIIMRNKSVNDFEKRFIHYVTDVGSTCTLMDSNINNEELLNIKEKHLNIKHHLQVQRNDSIAIALELSEEEVVLIQDKFYSQDLITTEELYAYEKYRLRRDYKWNGNIDPKFIELYNNNKTRRNYRNLIKINKYDSIDDSLYDIQLNERMYYNSVMANGVVLQHEDLNHNYTYNKHRLSCGLIRSCGFATLYDDKWVPLVTMSVNLRDNEKNIYKSLGEIQHEFNISISRKQLESALRQTFVKNMIKLINRIINKQYGMRIISNKEKTMYKLKHSELFTIDKQNTVVPFVGYNQDNIATLNENPDLLPYDDDVEYSIDFREIVLLTM